MRNQVLLCSTIYGSNQFLRQNTVPARPNVAAPGPNQPIVFRLFDDVGRPARDARCHEERRVQRRFQAQRVIEPTGRPIEVRKEVLSPRPGLFR